MTPLSSEERSQVNKFVRERLYERLKFHVLKNIRVQVISSSRSADQTALDLAVKEGVSIAFDEIESLAEPDHHVTVPVQPKQIQKRATSNNE